MTEEIKMPVKISAWSETNPLTGSWAVMLCRESYGTNYVRGDIVSLFLKYMSEWSKRGGASAHELDEKIDEFLGIFKEN